VAIVLNARTGERYAATLLSLYFLLRSGIRSGRCDLIKRLPGFEITLFGKVALQSHAAEQ
ncbi:TPA: hypothetical protein ACNGYZ_000783, partial [Raoultella planticola]